MTYKEAIQESHRLAEKLLAKANIPAVSAVYTYKQVPATAPVEIKETEPGIRPVAEAVTPQVVDLTIPPETLKPITDYMQHFYAKAAKMLPTVPGLSLDSVAKNPMWKQFADAVKKAGGTIEVIK